MYSDARDRVSCVSDMPHVGVVQEIIIIMLVQDHLVVMS